MGHYELCEIADVYTQLMYSDYESVAQIAPGGAFFDTSTINCDNPLLSAQQAATIGCDAAAIRQAPSFTLYIGRRNVEGGGRQQRSPTPRSAPCSAFAARSPRTGTTTRRCSTRPSLRISRR